MCVEAYPSSANSFLCRVLKYINKDLKIGQHTHTIANIKIAFKYNIPVITIIRDPLDAISSRVVRFNITIEQCILEYINFYEFVAEHLNELLVLTFENIINNTAESLSKIENKTNTTLSNIDIEEAKKHAFSIISTRAKENKRLHKVSLPSAERENEKDNVKQKVLKSPNYHRSIDVYKHIFESII